LTRVDTTFMEIHIIELIMDRTKPPHLLQKRVDKASIKTNKIELRPNKN
jgi:hypothetical protein